MTKDKDDKITPFSKFAKGNDRADHFNWNAGDVQVEKGEPDRSDHFAWQEGDLEFLADRSGQFAWKKGDLEFKKKKGDVQEDVAIPTPRKVKELDHAHAPWDHAELSTTPHPDVEEPHKDNMAHWENHLHVIREKHGQTNVWGNPVLTSLHHYKEDSYSYFNNHLRDHYAHTPSDIWVDDGVHERVAHLEHLTSLTVKKPLNVYRGFGSHRDLTHMRVGQHFIDHGFTGTSFRKDMGHSYGLYNHGEHWDEREKVFKKQKLEGYTSFARIHVPAGSKGFYLDHPKAQSPLESEKEFVLHRGTRFRCIGHSLEHATNNWGTHTKSHIVHLEVMGHHPKPIKAR